MTTKLSIHRALALITKSQELISEKTSNGVFAGLVVGEPARSHNPIYKSVNELKEKIQSDTDSVEGNIELILKLKEAIARSNLETKVIFLGKEQSINRLLSLKVQIKDFQNYLGRLRSISNVFQKAVTDKDSQNEAEANKSEASLKAEHLASLTKVSGLKIITENNNLSLNQKIEKIEELINTVNYDLDTILAENNLQTIIEIED